MENSKIDNLWEILNKSYKIYNLKQLREEIKKVELDIGLFTTPLKLKKD